MDEPTAWEEINPATAQRSAPPLSSLETATTTEFRNELTKCLALVAPVGMDEAAKADWLAAAWETVGHLPSDLLHIGCAHARKVADHPAKIVPAIISETASLLKARRDNAKPEPRDMPALSARPCEPKQAEEILREYGLLDSVRRA
jgi:hypothetical protein